MSAEPSQRQNVEAGSDTEIRRLYFQLLDAWNRRSAGDFAAPFAVDGNLIGFDGSQVDGREAIAAHIGQVFADHQTGAYVGKIREVRLQPSEVAILRAVVGMVPPGQTDINPAVNAIQSLVAVKQEGGWCIVLFQATPAQFHGRPELVQQLTDELRQLLQPALHPAERPPD